MNRSLTKRIAWKATFLAFMMLGVFSGNSLYANNIVIGRYVQQQSVTVQQELTIKELFKLIEKQTDFDFFYSSSLNELENKVDLNLINTTVDVVLEAAFTNSDLEFTIKDKDVMIRKNPNSVDQQQEKTVTGVVKDENGDTLPGASVVVKGSTTGVSTDFDGKYQINVSEGQVLIFSFMGYTDNEVVVGASSIYDISMEPSSSVLDEIIVSGVASGTSKKKMSVSVAKVNSDALTQVPQSSVSSSLQGKVAGVTVTSGSGSPGSGSSLVLRGATQLAGSQSPMILIDGVIMQGALSDINVDDIESMEIVKGAAASALYGSRAGNGVVVITSKRGSRLNSGETTVTIRNEIGIQQVAKTLDVATHHAYLLAPDWQSVDTYTKYATVDYPTDYVTGWNPNIVGNRILMPNEMMTQPYRVNNDTQTDLFDNGLSYTNYVGVANRVNQTNLFISFENNSNQGVLKETGGYDRQSFRVNLDHAINENIKISASNNFIMTNNDMPGGGTSAFFSAAMMEPDVDLLRSNDNGDPYNFAPNHWNDIVYNPLYTLWGKSNISKKSRFMGNYEVNWKVFDWMSAKASYSVESQDYRRRAVTPRGMYTGIDNSTNPATLQGSIGYLDIYSSKILNQNLRATLSFNHSWDIVDFNGKLSYLAENNQFQSLGGYGRDFDFQDFNSSSIIKDENMYYREVITQEKAENLFAIASFVVKDRYIFDGLIRRDRSSLFGSDARTNNYYRVSAAYRISQDIELPGIQELKIRGAIGTAGQRPGFYYQYETYSNRSGQYFKSTLGNKGLKPSNSEEIELGLDISFLNMFTGEFTYSRTNTTDQFIKVPLLAHQGGYKYQWRNAATLKTNTIEAMVNAKVVSTSDWNWDLTLTFDRTRSEITELDVPEYQAGPQSSFFIREGESYGTMYGRKFVKTLSQMEKQLPTGGSISDYEVNSDGYVVLAGSQGTTNEMPILKSDADGNPVSEKIGDINPDFRMGLSSTLSYKNISFYMLWRYKQGGDIYNSTAQKMVNHNRHAMMDQYGKQPEEMKTFGYYQGFYDKQSINEFWVEDGTYVRLAETSISYRMGKSELGGLSKYISSINMSLIGKNLLTFSNYSGYDPEVTSNGYAFDNTGYPNFRTYSFSLAFNF